MDDAEGTAAVRPAATVVTFPQEAVFSNADTVRQRVASALLPDVRAVILDMTPTMFCDTSGLRELVIAHRLGHEKGVEMRVVVPSRLMRMITLTGLQAVLAIYPTLAAAMAADSASVLTLKLRHQTELPVQPPGHGPAAVAAGHRLGYGTSDEGGSACPSSVMWSAELGSRSPRSGHGNMIATRVP